MDLSNRTTHTGLVPSKAKGAISKMRSLETIIQQIHATSRNTQLTAMKRVLIIQNLSDEALKALKGGEAYASMTYKELHENAWIDQQ